MISSLFLPFLPFCFLVVLPRFFVVFFRLARVTRPTKKRKLEKTKRQRLLLTDDEMREFILNSTARLWDWGVASSHFPSTFPKRKGEPWWKKSVELLGSLVLILCSGIGIWSCSQPIQFDLILISRVVGFKNWEWELKLNKMSWMDGIWVSDR